MFFDDLCFQLQPFAFGAVLVHLLLEAAHLGKQLRGFGFVVRGSLSLRLAQYGLTYDSAPPPLVYREPDNTGALTAS